MPAFLAPLLWGLTAAGLGYEGLRLFKQPFVGDEPPSEYGDSKALIGDDLAINQVFSDATKMHRTKSRTFANVAGILDYAGQAASRTNQEAMTNLMISEQKTLADLSRPYMPSPSELAMLMR